MKTDSYAETELRCFYLIYKVRQYNINMTKTNTDDERCKQCGKPTEGLFETGRSRICRNPSCPMDKGPDWVDPDKTPPYGIRINGVDGEPGSIMTEPKKKHLSIIDVLKRSIILSCCLIIIACGGPSGLYEITDTEAVKRAYRISSTLLGLDLDDIKTFAFDETPDFCEGRDVCFRNVEFNRYFIVIPTTPNATCQLIMLAVGETVYGVGQPWRNVFGQPIPVKPITEAWCRPIQ